MLTRQHDDVQVFWGRHEDAYMDQIPIVIVLEDKRQLRALYNTYFGTITVGATIFPSRDLDVMIELMYDKKPVGVRPVGGR